MPTKKKVVYKTVPKPLKEKKNVPKLECSRCGTADFYSMEDTLNHAEWCDLAKQQQEAAAAAQVKRRNGTQKNH